MSSKFLGALACAVLLCGCNSLETVQFAPSFNQSAIVRDGVPAIVSRKDHSIVLVRPALRGEPSTGRLVFIVAVNNLTRQPVDFHVADISVLQTAADGSQTALDVIPFEQLANEEQSREVAAALLTGLAAGANAYSASRAGYGTTYGSVYTPHGVATFSGTYYSPTAAALAQANASAQNEAMISNTIETGQRNMAELQRFVLKDNTLMPGEWIGGQVHISPPYSQGGQPKKYTISISVAGDVHQVEVVQQSPQ